MIENKSSVIPTEKTNEELIDERLTILEEEIKKLKEEYGFTPADIQEKKNGSTKQ